MTLSILRCRTKSEEAPSSKSRADAKGSKKVPARNRAILWAQLTSRTLWVLCETCRHLWELSKKGDYTSSLLIRATRKRWRYPSTSKVTSRWRRWTRRASRHLPAEGSFLKRFQVKDSWALKSQRDCFQATATPMPALAGSKGLLSALSSLRPKTFSLGAHLIGKVSSSNRYRTQDCHSIWLRVHTPKNSSSQQRSSN